jgi:hypothetical protein
MPVKRLPSKPWSGWPSVRGMSAAVIAMRSTFSCAILPLRASRRPPRRRATSHSMTRRASNTCAACSRVGMATCAPRLCCRSTSPSCDSRCSACRTTVRDTSKPAARSSSRRRIAGRQAQLQDGA